MDTILTLYLLEFENVAWGSWNVTLYFPCFIQSFAFYISWLSLKTDLWGITESFLNNLFFQALPFTSVAHVITEIDCQPTTANGVLVFVVGQLKVHVLFLASLEALWK